MSRWRPKWTDALGVIAVFLTQGIPLLFVSVPSDYFVNSQWPRSAFIWVAIAGPVLEEMLCRAIALRSLEVRMPKWAAIFLLSALAAGLHPVFLEALPRQLVLSSIYVLLGDSIVASCLARIGLNAFVFLPLAPFFQRLHIYTIWK
jgi:membrane protease YdiL (CAAX protease family)